MKELTNCLCFLVFRTLADQTIHEYQNHTLEELAERETTQSQSGGGIGAHWRPWQDKSADNASVEGSAGFVKLSTDCLINNGHCVNIEEGGVERGDAKEMSSYELEAADILITLGQ